MNDIFIKCLKDADEKMHKQRVSLYSMLLAIQVFVVMCTSLRVIVVGMAPGWWLYLVLSVLNFALACRSVWVLVREHREYKGLSVLYEELLDCWDEKSEV